MANHFWNPDAADNLGNGLTFATAKKDLSAFSPSPGDTIRCKASPAPQNTGLYLDFTHKGLTGTIQSYNSETQVYTPTAITTNLYREGTWLASSNVTCTTSTTRKVGATAASIAIASGFTTGLIARYATGTLDLSGRQQISIRLRTSAAILSGVLKLRLSTAADCSVATHEFTLNKDMSALNTWYTFVFDNGSALNSAIQSIGLVAISDPATPTIIFDLAFASKAPGVDAITLNSLVGKNDPTKGTWYCINEINGTTLEFDSNNASVVSSDPNSRGYTSYQRTNETVALWKRECFVLDPVAAAATALHSISAGGTSGSPVTIVGGWDTTDMSTQTGFDGSFFLGRNGLGGMISSSAPDLTVRKISTYRIATTHATGNSATPIRNKFLDFCAGNITASSNTPAIWAAPLLEIGEADTYVHFNQLNSPLAPGSGANGASIKLTNLYITGCLGRGIGVNGVGNLLKNIYVSNNTGTGFNFNGSENIAIGVTSVDNLLSGMNFESGNNNRMFDYVAAGNVFYSIAYAAADTSRTNYVHNASLGDATKFASTLNYADQRCISTKEGGDPLVNISYCDLGTISDDHTVKFGSNTRSRKFSPTSVLRDFSYPLNEVVGLLYCEANTPATFSIMVRRSNTGIAARLRIKGFLYEGLADEVVSSSASAQADEWEELSITVTPTEDCVIEVLGDAYGGTTYSAYFDVTQPIYLLGGGRLSSVPSQSAFPDQGSYFPPN